MSRETGLTEDALTKHTGELGERSHEEKTNDMEIWTAKPGWGRPSESPSPPSSEKAPERDYYTKCIIDPKSGRWLCPECEISPDLEEGQFGAVPVLGWESGSIIKTRLSEDKNYQLIPETYANFEERFWFTNPHCVTKCQNQRGDLVHEFSRKFDRVEKVDIQRDMEKERSWDATAKKGDPGWLCLSCVRSDPEDEDSQDYTPDLKKMLKDQIEKGERREFEFRENIFTATPEKPNYMVNPYDGTVKSLECRTENFGKDPESKEKKCPGVYGGKITYWKKKKDGFSDKYNWVEVDYVVPNCQNVTKQKVLEGYPMVWGLHELERYLGKTGEYRREYGSSEEESSGS